MVSVDEILKFLEDKAAERKECAYNLLCRAKAGSCPGANLAAAEAAILTHVVEQIRSGELSVTSLPGNFK